MKKLVLALSIFALTACGPTTPHIDGTTSAAADNSLKLMMKGMKDGEYLQMQGDIKMLHSRYAGEEFGKVLNGKDKIGYQAEVDDTKAFFIKKVRDRVFNTDQAEIDEISAKIKELTDLKAQNNPKYDPTNDVFIIERHARIDKLKARQLATAALTDDVVWKEYGCGCSQSPMTRPQYDLN